MRIHTCVHTITLVTYRIHDTSTGVEIIAALHDVALEAQHRSEPMAAQMSAVEFVLADGEPG